MRLFVTGASGWIGSALVPELLEHGHEVVGLARSGSLEGAETVRGTLDDLDVLREAAAASDGVVHLAFKHEQMFSGDADTALAADRAAIATLGEVLAGKPLVIASGLAGLPPGRIGTEDDAQSDAIPRTRSEQQLLALADQGERSVSVRLAPTTHGDGDNGFMAFIVGADREHGVAGYPGDGSMRWPAVHRSDAARLFRLAVESAPAGSVVHAAAEPGVTQREIAEAIGRGLDLPVQAVPDDHFGWLAAFLTLDIQVSSAKTRELLGWEPTGPTLIEDLDAGYYFTR